MSDKLSLQWTDFKENVNSAFGRLRDDKEFSDVTLACEDGQQLEAHKVILATSSPFFEKIFKRNRHPHPLIYWRGFKSEDLASILDFLYFGEANVYQENLASFLAIAGELELQGLTLSDIMQVQEAFVINHKTMPKTEKPFEIPKTQNSDDQNTHDAEEVQEVTVRALPNEFSGDLEALDEKVKSMMERSENRIKTGSRQTTALICKVCGKEGQRHHIIEHIEANHLEGISIPCDHCGKAFGARVNLKQHKARSHK